MKIQDISSSFAAYARPSVVCSFTLVHWATATTQGLLSAQTSIGLEAFQTKGVRVRASEIRGFYCALRPGRPGKCKRLPKP